MKKQLKKLIWCLMVLFICVSQGFSEEIDDSAHPYFTDKLQISAGAIFPNFNTDVKLDGDNGLVGTTVDFEKVLGLEDELASPYAHLIWRINRKHRLEFTYYNIDRDGSKVLGGTINFGDQTYVVNTSMNTTLDMSVYRLGYDYSFINDGKKEFGLGISADILPVDFSVRALGGATESEGAVLVVPTVGIHLAYAFNEKFAVMGRLQGLIYDIDNQDGDVINCMLGFEYNALEHFSFGVAYAYYDFDVGLDAGGFEGNVAFVYRGPLVYGKIHF